MSPITPTRSYALHTPKFLHFDEPKVSKPLVVPIRKHDSEPLSATLRRLGAARESMSSNEELSAGCLGSRIEVKDEKSSLSNRLEHHKRRRELFEANQLALQGSEGLFLSRAIGADGEADHLIEGSRKPVGSCFDVDPVNPAKKDNKPFYHHIQSTTRGGQQAKSPRSTLGRLSKLLTGYMYSNCDETKRNVDNDHESIPMNAMRVDEISRPGHTAFKAKGDGWGGLRPHLSWWPDAKLGPLMSPTRSTASRLRSFRLQPHRQARDENAWVDEEEEEEEEDGNPPLPEPVEDAPHSIRKFRVKFPSYLPKPSQNRQAKLCSSSSIDSGGDDEIVVVNYTKTSAEGRPASRRSGVKAVYFLRRNCGLMVAFLLVLSMIAILAVIATSTFDHTKLNAP
ncbi:hypothetical protein CBS101457_006659 [Exobasidium rhododendri]|nr:hypothetical protein CBS101457_006659 [Exobasidium rhododendri]